MFGIYKYKDLLDASFILEAYLNEGELNADVIKRIETKIIKKIFGLNAFLFPLKFKLDNFGPLNSFNLILVPLKY